MSSPLPRIDEAASSRPIALTNGRIWTADSDLPEAEALLITGRSIAAVGATDSIMASAPADTLVVDLQGRMAMPGIHDAHTHLLFSGLKFRYECRLAPDAGPDRVVHDLSSCLAGDADHGQFEWVVGGEINPFNFPAGELDRQFLDEAFPDRPVFLYDYTIHHGLANTRALELAGIGDATADTPGGRYVRRADTGELTGELVEQATWPVKRAIPDRPEGVYRDVLRWAAATSNRFGITSVQEASASRQELEALNFIDAAGELSVRVAAHLVWREEGFGMASMHDLDETIQERHRYTSEHVRTNFIKLWLDGAPLPPHFTQAGITDSGAIDDTKILIPRDELRAAIGAFDAAGLSVKLHCGAEGAVRVALDVIEEVRQTNGAGPVHEVAHCGFVTPTDVERFQRLNVVAEMSPAIWHRKEPEFQVLDAGFRFRTLNDAGAHLTIGSDWIIAPDPNLFPALQGVLERGSESLPIERALEVMTIEGARAVGLGSTTGSIAVGKFADVIVLDRDVLSVGSGAVGDTRVLLTLFEGRPVYQADV